MELPQSGLMTLYWTGTLEQSKPIMLIFHIKVLQLSQSIFLDACTYIFVPTLYPTPSFVTLLNEFKHF